MIISCALTFQSPIFSTNCKSRDFPNKAIRSCSGKDSQEHSRNGSFLYRDAPLNILNYFYFCRFFRARLLPIVLPRFFFRFCLSGSFSSLAILIAISKSRRLRRNKMDGIKRVIVVAFVSSLIFFVKSIKHRISLFFFHFHKDEPLVFNFG